MAACGVTLNMTTKGSYAFDAFAGLGSLFRISFGAPCQCDVAPLLNLSWYAQGVRIDRAEGS